MLDSLQQAVVDHDEGPALVHAVAGAGKTRCVIARASRLAAERKGSVLLVTFSRTGADVMRRRLTDTSSITVTTAHALAYKLLQQPQIDEMRFRFLADRVRRDQHLHDTDLDELLDVVRKTKAKMSPLPPINYAGFYGELERRRKKEGIQTFDDMLLEAAHLNCEQHWLQYDYVIQDEAQDQNEVQEAFITSCCGGSENNYMAVGDPWQACYEFRGSSPGLLDRKNFEKRWNHFSYFLLSNNYRSTRKIVAAADHISEPRAVAVRQREGEATFVREATVEAEAQTIARLIKQQSYNFKDVSILYRRHTQAGVIEAILRQNEIPLWSPKPFREVHGASQLLSYLWLAAKRGAPADVKKSLNFPFRFIPSSVTDELDVSGQQEHQNWEQAVRNLQAPPIRALEWARLVDRLVLLAENEAPSVVLSALSGVLLQNKIRSSYGLSAVCRTYTDLHDLLDQVGAGTFDKKGVRLSSIHDAKGQEFPIVFFVGFEPKPVAFEGGTNDEEKRLNYIAFTRAKEVLHVSSVG
jgi:DNA helicase-2/ATP-dependent DNA helicase PcrA